jgi:ribosome maturation factor RimP
VLHTAAPIDGRSKFTGDLVGIEGDDVVLKIEEEQYRVPFDRVERARLKADFD